MYRNKAELVLDLTRQFEAQPDLGLFQKAHVIAKSAHSEQRRISGGPYLEHLEAVARKPDFDNLPRNLAFLKDSIVQTNLSVPQQAAALLHDSIQKTWITADDLRFFGIPDECVEIVEALTPQPGEPYFKGVQRVNRKRGAGPIKINDCINNSDMELVPARRHSTKLLYNWNFQYPLTVAFISAVLNGHLPNTATVESFIDSDFCPPLLRSKSHEMRELGWFRG